MPALIAICLIEEVMGLTAGERFSAVKQVEQGNSNPMLSKWFTITMVVILAGSIAALVIVSLSKKIKQHKAAKKATLENSARKLASRTSEAETYALRPANGSTAKTAFIALFPTFRKAGAVNAGALSPPGSTAEWNRQLPEFVPATVTGLFGRVVFLETMLKAGVGDRVLVVMMTDSQELIEDMGLVQQSSQPAETIKSPDSRRLAIALVGISEQQSAQLAGTMGIAKAIQPAAAQFAGAREETK